MLATAFHLYALMAKLKAKLDKMLKITKVYRSHGNTLIARSFTIKNIRLLPEIARLLKHILNKSKQMCRI